MCRTRALVTLLPVRDRLEDTFHQTEVTSSRNNQLMASVLAVSFISELSTQCLQRQFFPISTS